MAGVIELTYRDGARRRVCARHLARRLAELRGRPAWLNVYVRLREVDGVVSIRREGREAVILEPEDAVGSGA